MVRSSPEHVGERSASDSDAISVFGSSNVWIDHCYLARATDGLLDVIHASTAVTISNSYFTEHDKVMLLGHNDEYTADRSMKVTVAFNHFGRELVQRMPRVVSTTRTRRGSSPKVSIKEQGLPLLELASSTSVSLYLLFYADDLIVIVFSSLATNQFVERLDNRFSFKTVMLEAKAVSTPISVTHNLGLADSSYYTVPAQYRALLGFLRYL
ncbi:PREDICTED: putative pectate lyase 2 [Nicotiana attenuata]|uniref:putative pectate lyase 2 n=1 Tax=Nicotiana attenuata TaxID=49451 RepID=UPI0009051912|nr:PREDICTED: putative pectate lyase 2 [Nicotiana attenuata]